MKNLVGTIQRAAKQVCLGDSGIQNKKSILDAPFTTIMGRWLNKEFTIWPMITLLCENWFSLFFWKACSSFFLWLISCNGRLLWLVWYEIEKYGQGLSTRSIIRGTLTEKKKRRRKKSDVNQRQRTAKKPIHIWINCPLHASATWAGLPRFCLYKCGNSFVSKQSTSRLNSFPDFQLVLFRT